MEIDAVVGIGIVELLMEEGDVEGLLMRFGEVKEEEGVGFRDVMELEASIRVGGLFLRDIGSEVGLKRARDECVFAESVEDPGAFDCEDRNQ